MMSERGLGYALAASLFLAGCASTSPAPVVGQGGQQVAASAAVVPGKDMYTVKRGDTLYSIALDHGVDHKELAAWNSIENINRIAVGQSLRVKPPGSPAAGEAAVARPIAATTAVEKRPLDSNTETLKREPRAGKETYSDQALAQAQGQPKAAEPAVVAAVRPEAKPETKTEAPPEAAAEEIAWIWPASGKVVGAFSEGAGKGVDIAGKAGDPVLAAGDGKVILASNSLRGYGNMVVINHSSTLLTVYAHNSKILVKEGQRVTKGQKIAEMGNTDADQVKLHFEVRRQGKPVDPLKFLPQR